MRRVAKTDENQLEITKALRGVGAVVTSLHQVGGGVADLLVSYRNCWHVLEIKRKDKGRVTTHQKVWIEKQAAPVAIVYDEESALRAIGAISDWRVALGDD